MEKKFLERCFAPPTEVRRRLQSGIL